MKKPLTLSNQLTSTVKELNSTLQTIQPISADNETVQLITYTLLATALVGIFVYHYIKSHENN